MDRFGNWFTLGFNHLRDCWQQHIVPALVFYGVIMVVAIVFTAIAFAVMFGFMAAGEEELGMILLFVVVGVEMVLLPLLLVPLQVGYMRGTLRAMRGQGDLTVGDLFSCIALTPKAFAVLFITMTAGMIGALFCYFPAFLIGALFFHALPAVADKGLGPIDAIKESIRLAKPRYWALVLYVLLYGFILAFVGYIPLIGPILIFPMATIFALAPYLDAQDEIDGDHPADVDQWQDEQFGSV
jgi:hypothetical protein